MLVAGQSGWPRTIEGTNGAVIRVYHPQPDSMAGNIWKMRAAFSVTRKGEEPRFGSFVALNTVETDRNERTLSLLGSNVLSLRFSEWMAGDSMEDLKETIECGLPGIGSDISLDRLIALMDRPAGDAGRAAGGSGSLARLDNTPPRIFLAERPSILVVIDGFPKFKMNKDWGVRVITNSPYAIAESTDGWFYLYGRHRWYVAPMPEGPYLHSGYYPRDLMWMKADIDDLNRDNEVFADTLREENGGVRDIVVSAAPAELIQTQGPPVYRLIPGTGLKYVANTDNDIFLDTLQRKYYVLLSGRWFCSDHLNGKWVYVASDSLPQGFAGIPEGSPKDRVLACVAGTAAAEDALLDVDIPQTARVSRAAKAEVSYDGPPQYAAIKGTHLQYVLNSSVPVFVSNGRYYCIDRAVWFVAASPSGPWSIAVTRPEEVGLIPPDCPVYNCKFVYVYDDTPDYIVTGYTTGYLGSYVQGGTVVYGTGYYYPSWTGNVSFPRPWTWGFNMWFNPWLGWMRGYDYSPDWLNSGAAWDQGFWKSGWWWAMGYRPPFFGHRFAGRGLFGRDARQMARGDFNDNIYLTRPDVYVQPAPEAIFTDRSGNIYRDEGGGSWSIREGSAWRAVDPGDGRMRLFLKGVEESRQRGELRLKNLKNL